MLLPVGGGSMKSKLMRSLIPSDLSSSTTLPRLVRWISGTDVSSISAGRSVWGEEGERGGGGGEKVHACMRHQEGDVCALGEVTITAWGG